MSLLCSKTFCVLFSKEPERKSDTHLQEKLLRAAVTADLHSVGHSLNNCAKFSITFVLANCPHAINSTQPDRKTSKNVKICPKYTTHLFSKEPQCLVLKCEKVMFAKVCILTWQEERKKRQSLTEAPVDKNACVTCEIQKNQTAASTLKGFYWGLEISGAGPEFCSWGKQNSLTPCKIQAKSLGQRSCHVAKKKKTHCSNHQGIQGTLPPQDFFYYYAVFRQILGSGPPLGSKLHCPPTKILDPRL